MQKMNHFGGKKKSRENEACGKKKSRGMNHMGGKMYGK